MSVKSEEKSGSTFSGNVDFEASALRVTQAGTRLTVYRLPQVLKQLQLVALRPGPAPIGKIEVKKLKSSEISQLHVRSNQVLDCIVMLLLAVLSTQAAPNNVK